MVTAEHVAAAMALSDRSWKQIEIRERENKQSIAVRIQRVAGVHAEKLAVLELQTQFSGAQALQIRMKPLAPEERVVTLRIPRQSIALRRGSIRTLWRQRKPCRHGAARDVRRGQSSRARSRCVRCPGAGLRGPRGRHRQQHLHTNPAASVPCDAGLDSLGESQRRCRAQSGLGGFVADRRHGEPHWREPIGSTQGLPATELVVDARASGTQASPSPRDGIFGSSPESSRCTARYLAAHRWFSFRIPWKSRIAQSPSHSVGCLEARGLGAAGIMAGAVAGWEYGDPYYPRPYDAGSVAPLSGTARYHPLA